MCVCDRDHPAASAGDDAAGLMYGHRPVGRQAPDPAVGRHDFDLRCRLGLRFDVIMQCVDGPVATWRVRLIGRMCSIAFIVFLILPEIGAVLALTEGALWALPCLVVFLLVGVWVWCMGVRPAVSLTRDELVIRNPFNIDRISLREVVALDPGNGGLTILTTDKTAYQAWAVQKSNLAHWVGWHTRADRVAEEIRKAALSAGAPVRPANPMRRRYTRGFRPRHARKDPE